MIVLDELAIGFLTLILGHLQLVPLREGAANEIIVKRVTIVRPLAVGAALRLELQKAQIEPHLQDFAAIIPLFLPHADALRIIRPIAEDAVDVLFPCHRLAGRSLPPCCFSMPALDYTRNPRNWAGSVRPCRVFLV